MKGTFNTETSKERTKITSFSLKRKPLASSYGDTRGVLAYLKKNDRNQLLDISTFTNGGQLDKYFRNPGERKSLDDCIKLSNTLYDTNLIYQRIINYYTTMYFYRYLIVPRKFKDSKIQKDYGKMYAEMLEYGDGMNIPVVYTKILTEMFKNGRVFLYVNGNTSSKTASTMMLPNRYCRPTVMTQYGTQQVDFDYQFFDSLGLTNEDKIKFLQLFPDEFQLGYEIYSKDRTNMRWQPLNYKLACCISCNEDGFPTLLSVFYDIIDYKTYKLNELDRNTNLLERFVSQEIDLEKTDLDMAEVQDLHDSMAEIICQNRGTTLITTVGKIAVHQLQKDVGEKNETLANAYKSIYDNAGLNNALFAGVNSESLVASLRRDEAYVWSFIEQITTFYNLAINNIKNFGNYQLSLKILPITVYNEGDRLNVLHQSATLGVGVLDYIVGTGTKQVDLEASLELEEFLDLSNRLVPLQSSHTQSSTVSEKDEEGDEEQTDPDKKDEAGTDSDQSEEVSSESSKEDSNITDEEDSKKDEK